MDIITIIIIALMITKVIDFNQLGLLDIVIIILFFIDVILKLKDYFNGNNGNDSAKR